ncbi:uncharacterized protein PAC_10617 [Phialocephala subalpina]|uniref:CHAT domain-containing protein n=1 Tax=Phialocephala subalpina TaxID=576137 RepID=A0A1L7X6T0_9HELO|nr:uncharacterized protein PAC_10617 [Phialocephala subalpina]
MHSETFKSHVTIGKGPRGWLQPSASVGGREASLPVFNRLLVSATFGAAEPVSPPLANGDCVGQTAADNLALGEVRILPGSLLSAPRAAARSKARYVFKNHCQHRDCTINPKFRFAGIVMETTLVVIKVEPSQGSGSKIDVFRQGESVRTVELPKAVLETSKGTFDEDLEWLVERHAIQDPFEVTRAEKVSHTLRNYAAELFQSLQLDDIPSSDSNPRHVLLEVREFQGAPRYFRAVHWEALEEVSSYSNRASNVSGLTVRRVIGSSSNGDSKLDNEDLKLDNGLKDVLQPRVLAVTARKPGIIDIPHRLITRPILETMKVLGKVEDFDVLRPPTFNQLKEQLKSKGAGYYHVVHLDVHGVIRDNKPRLCFIQSRIDKDSVKWEVDETLADEVGDLLDEYNVKIVVLNACESAKEGDDPNLNLARAFVQKKSIDTVVAMSYKLLETAAPLFMQAFYYQLFRHKSHTAFSARFGREQLMRERGRKTNFGTEVKVHDYFVPIIYEARSIFASTQVLDALQPSLTSIANSLQEYDRWLHKIEKGQPAMVGREVDLLLLEMDLYQYVAEVNKKKVLKSRGIRRIEGEAGVGKSALLADAIKWWRETGFIEDHIFFSHLDSVWEVLATSLNIEFAENVIDMKGVMELRRKMEQRAKTTKKPYLFIFDETASTQERDLLKYAPMLKGIFLSTESLVIIASRITKPWHRGLTNLVKELDPLTRDNSIKLGFEFLKANGAVNVEALSPAALGAVTNIIKLASGNPLALKILMRNFAAPKLVEAPQDYFTHLMRGHKIRIHDSWWENGDHDRSNSIEELKSVLEKDSSQMVHLLLPFWLKIPNFETPYSELRTYCWWYVEACWRGEEDQDQKSSTPPDQPEGNWWGTFPDAPDKASQRTMSLMFSESTNFPVGTSDLSDSTKRTEPGSSSNHSAVEDFPDDFNISESDSDSDEFDASDDEFNDNRSKLTFSTPRRSWLDNVIKKADPEEKYVGFLGKKLEVSKKRYEEYTSRWNSLEDTCKNLEKLGFLIKNEAKEKTKAKYLRLHPLVPLVLRHLSSPESRAVCRQIYPRFIAYKIKTWPLDKLHADEAWVQEAHVVAGAEFINLLVAAYFIIEPFPVRGKLNLDGTGKSRSPDEVAEYCRLAELIRITLAMQKGILGDQTRQTVVAWFWEEARWQFQSEIEALKRITPTGKKQTPKNWSNSLCELRESITGSGVFEDFARALLVTLEIVLFLATLTFRVTQFWWRLAIIAYGLRDITAETLLLSLCDLALSAFTAIRERIKMAMMTNSKAPIRSLLMESVSMLYICNLFNYYDGMDQRKMEFYVLEAKLLTKKRTRVPVLDIAISCAFNFITRMLAKFLQPSSKEDIVELLAMRQKFFNGLSRLGYDTTPYTKRRALPGLPPEVGGILDLRNSLSKPVEPILKALAASKAAMSRPGGGPDAMKLLQDALAAELHDSREDIGGGRGPRGGGAIPHNVVYLYRGLAEAAGHEGNWKQALEAWEEAIKWEGDGKLSKSRQRELSDAATLQHLREMAELEKAHINGAAINGDRLYEVDEESEDGSFTQLES